VDGRAGPAAGRDRGRAAAVRRDAERPAAVRAWRYARYQGYPGPEIPGLDAVAAWLDRQRPSRWTPGIMHGDYHFANVMYAHDGPRLVAIVDWEMCTIGDPLLDLGWLLAT
jgi:aminoglycoside phosphotransferase (APT) family kinase protein